MSPMLTQDLGRLLPDYILTIGATILLILGTLSNDIRMRDFLRWVSVVLLGAAAFALAFTPADSAAFAGGWLYSSPIGNTFGLVFLALTAWMVVGNRLPDSAAGEWYGLYLFACSGMLLLSRAGNLPAIFMGVEVMSLSLYILVAFQYKSGLAIRGAMQYLVLASFASAFLAFGLALVFAGTGTMNLQEIQVQFADSQEPSGPVTLALFGVALVLVGVAFKLSAAPFHMWAGDVYEAAPAPVAGLIATASKGATFAALLPFIVVLGSHWMIVWILATASVLIGNLLALRETRVQRILAYSSVAHVGYVLMGFLAGGSQVVGSFNGPGTVLFYVVAYSIATVGAFGVLGLLQNNSGQPMTLRDLRGVAKQSPMLAFALMMFVVSMSALPPSIGFHGKLFLFSAAYAAGYSWLVLIGLVGSAIGLFYYLRILVHLYMMPSDAAEIKIHDDSLCRGVLVVTAIGTIVLAFIPGVLAQILGL